MSTKGKSYEVIKPSSKEQTKWAIITLVIGLLCYLISNFIFLKILAGVISFYGIFQAYQALQLSNSAIAFFEKGIQIKKRPNHALEYIPIEKSKIMTGKLKLKKR